MDFVTSLFVKGGPVMWPLLLCSIVSLAIILERLIFWWRIDWRRDDEAIEEVFSQTEKGDPEAKIPAGTRFEDLPADWVCPVCGAGKDQFQKEDRA